MISQYIISYHDKLYNFMYSHTTWHNVTYLAEEGMKGFYKGIIPTTAKAVVATAVTFAAYEVI